MAGLAPEIEAGLQLIRVRQRRMAYVLLGLVPFVLVAACADDLPADSEAFFILAAAAYGVFLLAYCLRLAFTECPRCHGFYHWKMWSDPWTQRCLHCGLALREYLIAFCLGAAVMALPMPAAAQTPELAAGDYQLFLQSVSARQTARNCARGIPGYRQRFDALYRQWSEKHGQRLRRGQAVLREALSRRDDPNIDREHLMQVQSAVAQLSQSPPNTIPIELDEPAKVRCAATLAELEAGLK